DQHRGVRPGTGRGAGGRPGRVPRRRAGRRRRGARRALPPAPAR
ncbi:MAG: hypothetical protein AVDCRST_MAG66-3, partial [uncultured Pseudonocardia sp.]